LINYWQRLLVGTLMAMVLTMGPGRATALEFSTHPITHAGSKWRIGYYQGGDYRYYYRYLRATVAGLMTLGWIEPAPIPRDASENTRALWDWLVHQASSAYLEFLEDGFYSAGWDDDSRTRLRHLVINRLHGQRDVDLMIAMGTWAGKDLANDQHDTPTLVISSSDPIGAGILSSPKDSGRDHLFVHLDPYRFERQVRMFHDIVGFKTLGMAYEDTVAGRSYAAIDKVEQVAREKGFKILRCHTRSDIADQSLAEQSVIRCFNQLAERVDAMYVTAQGGISPHSIPELVRITREHGVATFTQFDSDAVKQGFLLGASHQRYEPVGEFLASTMARIMNGARPRQLEPVFEQELNISINLDTANRIGLYLRADVLAAADEIYPK